MRYSYPDHPFVWFSLIVNFFTEFIDCEDICILSGLLNYSKVTFENYSHLDARFYKYSQRISLGQPHPIVKGEFKRFSSNQSFTPDMSFEYYGTHVKETVITTSGDIDLYGEMYLGQISNRIEKIPYFDIEILNEKELFAVKWSSVKTVSDVEDIAKITCLIYPNGKITIHYDKFYIEDEESFRESKISGTFKCEKGNITHMIVVHNDWIIGGTLVEYEVIEEICPKYNTTEACEKATTRNMTCIWCAKSNTCIDSYDEDTHDLKVNDCRIEISSSVTDLSTPTPIKQTEATSRVTEVKNLTTEISKEKKRNTSNFYLYILIPLIVSFFVLCIGCFIYRWLYKKKKLNE